MTRSERAGRYARAARRWTRLLTARRVAPGLRVSYGFDRVPTPDEPSAGGTSKFQKLAVRFPNHPDDFTLLYLGSSALPRDLGPQLRIAGRRGAAVVLNQDGVGYPGWAGERTDAVNRPLRQALQAADHVLYQTAFCKRSADQFLGEATCRWEILPNAVDTGRFTPADAPPADGPVILVGGDQTQVYRLELALRTVAVVRRVRPDARLLVTGRLASDPRPLIAELGLDGSIELAGRYAQSEAPALYRRAHILLHTKVNDPCPNVVLEAMASGLPVVHPASGGTVELVADEAGIGVPHPDAFERDTPPEPEAMAAAVDLVLAELPDYSAAARRRAVEHYPLPAWLDRHATLFSELAAKDPVASHRGAR